MPLRSLLPRVTLRATLPAHQLRAVNRRKHLISCYPLIRQQSWRWVIPNMRRANTRTILNHLIQPGAASRTGFTRLSGNHEYLTSDATGYYDYFNGTGQTSGPAGDRDKGYYAFDVGTWRIYAINSNCSSVGGCGAGSPQEQWLAADLAANPAQCQLMFMHHPYVSSHTKDSYSSYTQQSVLWQDFYEANGDVVLAGHAHFYERFAEQNPARVADPGRGIRLFVVGTGGKGTYNFGVTRPNSEARIGSTFGVLKLQLHPDSYDWSFIAIDGSVLDAGTTSCQSNKAARNEIKAQAKCRKADSSRLLVQRTGCVESGSS